MDNQLRCQIERATVRALLAHLDAHGWKVWGVDYDETKSAPTVAKDDHDVMAMVFNLDEVNVYAAPAAVVDAYRALRDTPLLRGEEKDEQRKQALQKARTALREATHSILIVLGNTFDTISDWRFREGDPDGFNAVMNGMHAEWERWQEDPAYLLRKLQQCDRIALLCRAHRDATDERAKGGARLPVIFIAKGAPRYLAHAQSPAEADQVLIAHRLSAEKISLAEVDSAGWSQRCYVAHA